MKKNNKNGFTLVELLSVIVILAVILIIAVPRVMDVIKGSRIASLENTAKMIANGAEKLKIQNSTLDKDEEITCEKVTKINKEDYDYCNVVFDGNTAKVKIIGKGKFAGLNICSGTKSSAIVQEESCGQEGISFKDDDWKTIVRAVKSRSYPYKVGDEKTIDLGGLGTHTIRVANTTPCENLNLASQTACGFVLEFVDTIGEEKMSEELSNYGGWPSSIVRNYVNITIYNSMPEELKNGIIDTYVVSGHGDRDKSGELADGNFGSTDKLYLLSTMEVWGINSEHDTAATETITRQLDYYADKQVNTSNFDAAKKQNENGRCSWWLRSAYSEGSNEFNYVGFIGKYSYIDADAENHISPAFRIG